MCYIDMMEYYSATKINEILIFATKWMQLEIIMLSDISQVQILWFVVVNIHSKKKK